MPTVRATGAAWFDIRRRRRMAQAAVFTIGIGALAAVIVGRSGPDVSAAPAVQAATPVATVAVPTPAVELPVIPAPQVPAAAAVALTQRDIYFDPSALTIPADSNVRIDLANGGAAMHNFSITSRNNPGLPDLGISVDLDPGQTGEVIVNAPPGTYYFFCDEPGHEAAGMVGQLTVQ